MGNTKYNNKQIEEWAILAVKERLLTTDTLSPYINENDKTPSWDGEVIIFEKNGNKKNDIFGKTTVQVKGQMTDNIKKEECSFPVDMADLVNYKNDGGTIFFVVLIDKNKPQKRRVFYDTLTPVKIGRYIEGHQEQASRVIKLKRFPEKSYEMKTIFYNFYCDSSKQHSFKHIPPITLKELSSRKDIIQVKTDFTIFSTKNKCPSPIQALLSNEIYFYAEIAGSPILHPIEYGSDMAVISKKGFLPVFINGERYDDYISERQTKSEVIFQFGESTTLVFTEKTKGAKMNFRLSGLLSHRIKDLNFLISLVESSEIDLGENRKIRLCNMVAKEPFDMDYAKKELESYRRIDRFWKSLGIVADFDIENIDSNSSLDDLNILINSINGRQPVYINVDSEHSCYLLRQSISNFIILFFIDCVDKEKSLYNIYDFFDYKGIIQIVRGDSEYITSPYSVLSPDDFITLSNIDLSKMLQSYKDLINSSSNIFEAANYDLLNLLLAYDKLINQPVEMLNVAKEIAYWILNESGDKVAAEIKTVNYLQTLKRERELTTEENKQLYEIAESEKSRMIFKVGANLLLENYKVARIQFELLSDEDKEAFRSFPIYKFWK